MPSKSPYNQATKLLGRAKQIRIQVVLHHELTDKRVFQALQINADDAHAADLFNLDIGYFDEKLEKEFNNLSRLARVEAMLDRDRDSTLERASFRPSVARWVQAVGPLTICLATIGLPHSWTLVEVAAPDARTPVRLSQVYLLQQKLTLAAMARRLQSPGSDTVQLAVVVPAGLLKYSLDAPLPGTGFIVGLYLDPVHGRVSSRGAGKNIPCGITEDHDTDGAHLVDYQYEACFSTILKSLETAFGGSGPAMKSYFDLVHSSLEDLRSVGFRMNVATDYLFLNPQVHRYLDSNYWFAMPFGSGSWTWISSACPIPLSMALLIERGSAGFQPFSKQLAVRSTLAAATLASAIKIALGTLATDRLRGIFQQLAASAPAPEASPVAAPQTSTASSTSNNNKKKKRSHSSSRAGPSNPSSQPSGQRPESASSQAASAKSVGGSGKGGRRYAAEPQQGLDAETTMVESDPPDVLASSSTRFDSDPFEPKAELSSDNDVVKEERDPSAVPLSAELLARKTFEDRWISSYGARGTPETRQAALVIERVAKASTSGLQHAQRIVRLLNAPLGTLRRAQALYRSQLVTPIELASLGVDRAALKLALDKLGDEGEFQDLLRDKSAASFYFGYPVLVARLRGSSS